MTAWSRPTRKMSTSAACQGSVHCTELVELMAAFRGVMTHEKRLARDLRRRLCVLFCSSHFLKGLETPPSGSGLSFGNRRSSGTRGCAFRCSTLAGSQAMNENSLVHHPAGFLSGNPKRFSHPETLSTFIFQIQATSLTPNGCLQEGTGLLAAKGKTTASRVGFHSISRVGC